MLRSILESSLRFRPLVVAIAAVVIAVGVARLDDMPVDVFPEVLPPTVQIQIESLGLSADEVEQMITVPMEADLLNGVPWLKSIDSESITGLSSIEMFFMPGTDLMQARQMVQERLFTPLGMTESSLPLIAENLPSDAPTGYSATGVAEAPWTINGWAPAGGARSTAADLARYAQVLLDGAAPGMDALVPRWQFGAQQIGYVWTTAVIVLSNTAAEVDTAANRLLIGEHAWISSH